MTETHNTSTHLEGKISRIDLSGEVPHFSVAYSPPTYVKPHFDSLNELQNKYDESTLLLGSAQLAIDELRNRVEELTAQIATNGPRTLDFERENPDPINENQDEAAIEPESTVSYDKLLILGGIAIDPDNNYADEVHQPGPQAAELEKALSPVDQNCERAILHLLGFPDQTIKSDNAGGDLRLALGIEERNAWSALKAKLLKQRIIDTVKSPAHSRRDSEIRLSIENVLAVAPKQPFVTPRIIEALERLKKVDEIQDTDSTLDSPAGSNKEHEVQEKIVSSNGSGSSYSISPRVRRLMGEELSGPTYRDRGKGASVLRDEPTPFLAQSRSRAGKHRR